MTQPTLTTRAMKRLAKDLKNLIKEPLVGANAQPRDEDLSLWDATIKCPLSHPRTIGIAPDATSRQRALNGNDKSFEKRCHNLF